LGLGWVWVWGGVMQSFKQITDLTDVLEGRSARGTAKGGLGHPGRRPR
jgi:hypothetical protein